MPLGGKLLSENAHVKKQNRVTAACQFFWNEAVSQTRFTQSGLRCSRIYPVPHRGQRGESAFFGKTA